jgi:hypothetical protein
LKGLRDAGSCALSPRNRSGHRTLKTAAYGRRWGYGWALIGIVGELLIQFLNFADLLFLHFEGDLDGILEIFGEMSNFALR